MDLENLQQAASAHSTSKISTEADLYKIATLGFAEALHSLAQLGELEICSRRNDLGSADFGEKREPVTGENLSLLRGGIENADRAGGWFMMALASLWRWHQLRSHPVR